MCGIIGIIGKDQVADRLVDGLKRMEYRGYDSAGVCTLHDGQLVRRRAPGVRLVALFSVEHGLKLSPPTGFSTLRYETELDRLEATFNRQINTALTLVTTEKHALTQKFFETVAMQARRTFEVANQDVEQWLRAVMSPLETQVREYQIQLKRRLESVKRIHEATDTLENRVDELKQGEEGVRALIAELDALEEGVAEALGVVAGKIAVRGEVRAAA